MPMRYGEKVLAHREGWRGPRRRKDADDQATFGGVVEFDRIGFAI